MAARIRKDDEVIVIAGRDKGATGRVLKVFPDKNQVLVEGVNRVKRHQSPRRGFREAGIVEKELPIPASKVQLMDPKANAPTRVRTGEDKDGKKVRITARSGSVLS